MLAMTVYAGASAVLAPLIGNLMDRIPLRRLLVTGYAGLSLAVLLDLSGRLQSQ